MRSEIFEDVLREATSKRHFFYIGHQDPEISSFTEGARKTANGTDSLGIWATSNVEVAKSYSWCRYVTKIEVFYENPEVVDWKGEDWGVGDTDEKAIRSKHEGHDCIIFKNVVDPGYVEENKDGYYACYLDEDGNQSEEIGLPLNEERLFKPSTNICIFYKGTISIVSTKELKPTSI
jgi:hypothetical protein